MAKITYDTKVTLNPQPGVANANKVTDSDMNEIKTSVNDLYDEVSGKISNTYGTSQTVGYSQNYINGTNEYSTTEVDTGKKWTDGKAIYRRVVETTTGSTTGSWTKIADIPISTLISMFGYWIANNDKYPINRFYNNEGITTYWNLSGIYEIHNYAYANSKSAVLIIEYTKTS